MPRLKAGAEKLFAKTQESGFWDDSKTAQKISTELAVLQKKVEIWERMASDCQNLIEFSEIVEEGTPDEIQWEQEVAVLQKRYYEAEIDLFLSGEFDRNNAILTITPGPGGDDANDWAEMLLRMFLRFAERKEWKSELLDKSDAEVGIKSATVLISGANAFGLLKGESGTHRLVRLSPFNAKHSRETSFAKVDVVPEIESSDMTIEEKDLRIDTFRSQGAGGQHVNTTDSAVRITHIPTGIVVSCQNQRSQIQNREWAMKVLVSRLTDLHRQEEEEKSAQFRSGKTAASFGGGHIRSYVLDDRYVKDTRTEVKSSQPEKVLDGDLEAFIDAFLRMK